MQKKEHKSTKKKQIRLPIHVYLGYLLVAALLFTGVTFSRYVASTNAGDGARVATFGELKMTENDKPENFIITPGVNIEKNPLVSFGVEKPSESAAYVFVRVDAKNWKFGTVADATDTSENVYKIMKGDKELMRWSVDSDWKYATVDDNGCQVFYRYLSPNEKLNAVWFIKDGKITVSQELYASDYDELDAATKSITFNAYAVQANGLEGTDATEETDKTEGTGETDKIEETDETDETARARAEKAWQEFAESLEKAGNN